MKTLEYIKAFKKEKEIAYQQVLDNPEIYDKATQVYAKAMNDDARKWYEEALKREKENDPT